MGDNDLEKDSPKVSEKGPEKDTENDAVKVEVDSEESSKINDDEEKKGEESAVKNDKSDTSDKEKVEKPESAEANKADEDSKMDDAEGDKDDEKKSESKDDESSKSPAEDNKADDDKKKSPKASDMKDEGKSGVEEAQAESEKDKEESAAQSSGETGEKEIDENNAGDNEDEDEDGEDEGELYGVETIEGHDLKCICELVKAKTAAGLCREAEAGAVAGPDCDTFAQFLGKMIKMPEAGIKKEGVDLRTSWLEQLQVSEEDLGDISEPLVIRWTHFPLQNFKLGTKRPWRLVPTVSKSSSHTNKQIIKAGPNFGKGIPIPSQKLSPDMQPIKLTSRLQRVLATKARAKNKRNAEKEKEKKNAAAKQKRNSQKRKAEEAAMSSEAGEQRQKKKHDKKSTPAKASKSKSDDKSSTQGKRRSSMYQNQNACLCELLPTTSTAGMCRLAESQLEDLGYGRLAGLMSQLPRESAVIGKINMRERWLAHLGVTEAEIQELNRAHIQVRWTHFHPYFFSKTGSKSRRLLHTVEVVPEHEPEDILQFGQHRGRGVPVPCMKLKDSKVEFKEPLRPEEAEVPEGAAGEGDDDMDLSGESDREDGDGEDGKNSEDDGDGENDEDGLTTPKKQRSSGDSKTPSSSRSRRTRSGMNSGPTCVCELLPCNVPSGYCKLVEGEAAQNGLTWLEGLTIQLPAFGQELGGIKLRERWIEHLGITEEQLATLNRKTVHVRWTHFPASFFRMIGTKHRQMRRLRKSVPVHPGHLPEDMFTDTMAVPVPCAKIGPGIPAPSAEDAPMPNTSVLKEGAPPLGADAASDDEAASNAEENGNDSKKDVKFKYRKSSCVCELIDIYSRPGICKEVEPRLAANGNEWLEGLSVHLPKAGGARNGINLRERWLAHLGITEEQVGSLGFRNVDVRWTHFPPSFFSLTDKNMRKLKFMVDADDRHTQDDIAQYGKYRGQAIPVPLVNIEEDLKDLPEVALPATPADSTPQPNGKKSSKSSEESKKNNAKEPKPSKSKKEDAESKPKKRKKDKEKGKSNTGKGSEAATTSQSADNADDGIDTSQTSRHYNTASCVCELTQCNTPAGLCREAEGVLAAKGYEWLAGTMSAIPKGQSNKGGVNLRERWLAHLGASDEDVTNLKRKDVYVRWTHFPPSFFKKGGKMRKLLFTVDEDERHDPEDVIKFGPHRGRAIPVPIVDVRKLVEDAGITIATNEDGQIIVQGGTQGGGKQLESAVAGKSTSVRKFSRNRGTARPEVSLFTSLQDALIKSDDEDDAMSISSASDETVPLTRGEREARCVVKDPQEMANAIVANENDVEGTQEYALWAKYAPILYDFVITQQLYWPALSCSWIPMNEYTAPRSAFWCGSNRSDGSKGDEIAITTVQLPQETSSCENEQLAWSEGNFCGSYMGDIKFGARFEIGSDIHRVRTMPQDPYVAACFSATTDIQIVRVNPSLSDVVSAFTIRTVHTEPGYGLSWNNVRRGALLSSSDDGLVACWDLHRKRELIHYDDLQGISVNEVQWVFQSANEFACVDDSATISFGDIRQNRLSSFGSSQPPKGKGAAADTSLSINCMSFSPTNENCFVTGRSDGTVEFWDRRKGDRPTMSLLHHRGDVLGISWNPYLPHLVASCGEDGHVCIWDARGSNSSSKDKGNNNIDGPPELLFVHGGHTDKVFDISWCPDDPWCIVSTAENNIVQVWAPAKSLRV